MNKVDIYNQLINLYMHKSLIFKTKSLDVEIKEYKEHCFKFRGWTISDYYDNKLCKYFIIVNSQCVNNEDELSRYRIEGQGVIEQISMLIPLTCLPSLKTPKFQSFSGDYSLIDFQSAPEGWETNYPDVYKQIKNNNQKPSVVFEFVGITPYSKMIDSPLFDLQKLLVEYEKSEDAVQYLTYLNFMILSSSDQYVYMLIGKSLEIINAMYPSYNKNNDERIVTHFPELIDVFGSYTIHRLMDLSNNRKETRHYVFNKPTIEPHKPLSKKERIDYFNLSSILIHNVIRKKLGLSPQVIKRV